MILLLSVTEADCLGRQHRRVTRATNRHQRRRSAYRASGLVRCWFRDHGRGLHRHRRVAGLGDGVAQFLHVGLGRFHHDQVLSQLAGCGAEVAGGAAAVGGLQAEQARQAKAQQEQTVEKFKAAQDAAAARSASAADAAGRQ